MEDRETPRMHKYGRSKTTRIMMATARHVTAWAGRPKYQADGFLFDGVYSTRELKTVQADDAGAKELTRRGTVAFHNIYC